MGVEEGGGHIFKGGLLSKVYTKFYSVHVYLKDIPEDATHGAFKEDKPTYVRAWGLKRGEGIYSREACYQKSTVNAFNEKYADIVLQCYGHCTVATQMLKQM